MFRVVQYEDTVQGQKDSNPMGNDGLHFPSYEGKNIINLMASIALASGAEGWEVPPLEALSPQRLRSARNILLLVVDGLGLGYLQQQAAGAHLQHRLLTGLSTVAPPTTATAIPTFLTGQPPVRHGYTGWFTWLRELGCVSAVLPFVTRHGALPLADAGVSPLDISGVRPLFDRISIPSHVVSPRRIAFSAFNTAFSGSAQVHPYDDLPGMFECLAGLTGKGFRRKYIYAYWPELDSLSHQFGVGSGETRRHLEDLNRAFGAFLERIAGSDTIVLVSADHGFVDCPPERQIQMDQHPALRECLSLPLCGEPRFAYCYVHPQRVRQFERYVASELADQAVLMPAADLLEQGLFGPGEVHPRLSERIGHYALAMRENYVIKEWLPGDHRYQHLGFHGGLGQAELQVPLVYAEV